MTKNEILGGPKRFGKTLRKPSDRDFRIRIRLAQEKGERQNAKKDRPGERPPGDRVRAGYIHQMAEQRGADDRSQRIDGYHYSESCPGAGLACNFANERVGDALIPDHAKTCQKNQRQDGDKGGSRGQQAKAKREPDGKNSDQNQNDFALAAKEPIAHYPPADAPRHSP